MKRTKFVAAATAIMLFSGMSSTAFSAETLGEAFTQGKFGYSFRWRLENVDQDPFPHDATAIPLRARINFLTSDLKGWSAKAEIDLSLIHI